MDEEWGREDLELIRSEFQEKETVNKKENAGFETRRKEMDALAVRYGCLSDHNVCGRAYEYLYNDKSQYIGKTQISIGNKAEEEEIYGKIVIKALKEYDSSYEKSFSHYFIDLLRWSLLDYLKMQKTQINGEFVKRFEYIDAPAEGDMGYTFPADKNTVSAEKEYMEEDVDEVLDHYSNLLHEILLLTQARKRTQGSLMRLFFTDTLMTVFSELGAGKNREFHHEKAMFQNMEIRLVDYVYSAKIVCFKDMAVIRRKLLKQLIEFYDEELVLAGRENYRSIWGTRDFGKADREIEIPLSEKVFLAYLFVKEYEESGKTTVPTAPPQAYISKYKIQYEELLDGLKMS